MPIINSIAAWVMKKRIHQMELFMKYPVDVQNEWLKKLMFQAQNTEWGKRYEFSSINNFKTFINRIPLQDYESIKSDIERIRKGEQNILWPSEIKWFAKSSGTTSDKSKFIPVSIESLEECHYRGGKDMVTIHCNNREDTLLFTGKNLALGGSHDVFRFEDYESYYGDVSAIIIQNLPLWAEFLRAPNLQIALMNNWDDKLWKMAETTMDENVTSIAGVPSWLLLLLTKIKELKGDISFKEIWPNLEVYFHGGVSFTPYRHQFNQLLKENNISYLETFNASEGFFGLQDIGNSGEMLLMLDYGIYYEFLPIEGHGSLSFKTIELQEVELNKEYAMVISTNAGLWRYQLGDTIRFTSILPYRFTISGRTKHFINAFGEELMIDNAEKALSIACEKTGANIKEYTAAPLYFDGKSSGAHEWLIEFEKLPYDLNYFAEVLDNALKAINSDYEAKRYGNYILKMPEITIACRNLFYDWLKSKNRLGGQYKIPRLSNNREIIDQIKKSML